MNWGYHNQPPQYFPMGYPIPVPESKDEYVKFLKKELKAAKSKDDKKPDAKKDDKKKEWWRRVEIVSLAFFTAPFLGPLYIGIVKISWMLTKSILTGTP